MIASSTSAFLGLRQRRPLRAMALTAVGAAGMTAAVTALWHGQRIVMDIGGTCAVGGPYEIASACPQGTMALIAPSIPLIFVCGGLFLFGAESLCRGGVMLAVVVWPALFLSLGANFLQYAVAPPGGGGLVWGWLVCGVLFVAMGAPVLRALPRLLRDLDREGRTALLSIAGASAAAGVAGGTLLAAAIT